MGYRTPNIDRIAREGALFTDAYGEQSCTAGRAAFMLGQHPFRTGLLTIGMPGSEHSIPDWTPTIADLLKAQGYLTAQFGKNHFDDRWYADQMWLFVPIQQKIEGFFVDFDQYPYQAGSSLSAAGINY